MTPYVYTTMQTCTPHGTARTNHMHHVTGQFSGVPTRLVFRFAVNGLDLTRKFRRRLFSSTHMQIFSISLLKLLVCCTFNSLSNARRTHARTHARIYIYITDERGMARWGEVTSGFSFSIRLLELGQQILFHYRVHQVIHRLCVMSPSLRVQVVLIF